MKHTETDQALLSELAEALAEAETVPESIRTAGYTAFTWRRLDQELAELLFDSARAEDLEAAGVRSEVSVAALRTLSFGTGGMTLDLELHRSRMIGQVVPTDIAAIVVESETGRLEVPVDEFGCFEVSRLPAGRVRIEVTLPAAGRVVTPWIIH